MFEAIHYITGQMVQFVSDQIDLFWNNFNLSGFASWQIGLDILLVSVVLYWIFIFVRGTRAVAVILGILVLGFFSLLANTLELPAISWLFGNLATVFVLAIPVIFQPELRRALERLGRSTLHPYSIEIQQEAIENIVTAVEFFAKNKTGAILVVRKSSLLKEYYETGLGLNARLSTEILKAIFQKKSPLHDGAVVIYGNQIKAASVVLPLALGEAPSHWGTRHKSAMGISEQTDALAIVVSEERGQISLFVDGQASEKLSAQKLRFLLESHLLPTRWRKKIKK